MNDVEKRTGLKLQQGEFRQKDIIITPELRARIVELTQITRNANGSVLSISNIPAAYSAISEFLTKETGQQIDFDTILWFSQAFFINSALGSGLIN